MKINFWDAAGIQQPESAMPFEAAWDENGAICIAHVRVPPNVSLADLEAQAPRLAGRTGAACTPEAATAMGHAADLQPLAWRRHPGWLTAGDRADETRR